MTSEEVKSYTIFYLYVQHHLHEILSHPIDALFPKYASIGKIAHA